MPQELKNDREFRYNQKKFYAQSVASQSQLGEDERRFYKDALEPQLPNPVNKRSAHFKKDAANFHGVKDDQSEKGSVFKENAERFYGTAQQQKVEVNKKSQHFKKDNAKFWGESYAPSDNQSEKGSIFQNNAAEFYQTTKPKAGERPFKIREEDCKDKTQAQGKSMLNEMRLKEHEANMQRHPNFGKNQKRFFGMKSVSSVSGASSYAQKLDQFI